VIDSEKNVLLKRRIYVKNNNNTCQQTEEHPFKLHIGFPYKPERLLKHTHKK